MTEKYQAMNLPLLVDEAVSAYESRETWRKRS